MGRRRHPKNLPQCAGTVNSLLFFHIHKSASFFSKCFNFKLNTMQIFNLGQKKPQAGFRPWTGFQLFLQVRIQCLHTWMAICLFVYLFTMVIFFIMKLYIFVLCFFFQHKNLCICNSCTGIFRSVGKRLRSAEDNQYINVGRIFRMTQNCTGFVFFLTEVPKAVLTTDIPPA